MRPQEPFEDLLCAMTFGQSSGLDTSRKDTMSRNDRPLNVPGGVERH